MLLVPSGSSEEEVGWNASTIVPGSRSQQRPSWIEDNKNNVYVPYSWLPSPSPPSPSSAGMQAGTQSSPPKLGNTA